jgi:DNA-binding ferritin-like protein
LDGETVKQELLDKVRSARAEWDALIAQVPEERLAEPGVEGEGGKWTVKDIVAHVAIYEDWLAQQINAGGPNTPHEVDAMTHDQRNAWIFERHRAAWMLKPSLPCPRSRTRS